MSCLNISLAKLFPVKSNRPLVKILIAEDDPVILKVLKRKLQPCFQVDVAENGSRAMSQIHQNDYALVLLDLIMPEKNGFEVLEQMRKEKDKTPVLVFSNLAHEDEKKRALDLGAKGYFVKSDLDTSQILNIIQSFVGEC
jgi:two-component system, OmpR family, response regulator CiaR